MKTKDYAEAEGLVAKWARCQECGHGLEVLVDPEGCCPVMCPECGEGIERFEELTMEESNMRSWWDWIWLVLGIAGAAVVASAVLGCALAAVVWPTLWLVKRMFLG